jgi:hypothetical protein
VLYFGRRVWFGPSAMNCHFTRGTAPGSLRATWAAAAGPTHAHHAGRGDPAPLPQAARTPEPTLRLSQQQSPSDDWSLASKSAVSFLRRTDGKSKGRGIGFGHGGCGVALVHDAIRLNIDLLRESRLSRHQSNVSCYSTSLYRGIIATTKRLDGWTINIRSSNFTNLWP